MKKMDEGLPISTQELQKLSQPISDLQTGTAGEDKSWIYQLMESERFREAMRDSQEAQDLKAALLAAMKALNYWKK